MQKATYIFADTINVKFSLTLFLSVSILLPQNKLVQKAIWRGLSPSKKFEVFFIPSSFEYTQWEIISKGAVRSYIKTIQKNPEFPRSDQNKKQMFLKQAYMLDKQYIQKSALLFSREKMNFSKSLEARLFFFRPGQEKAILRPREGRYGIYLQGRPLAIALWINSSRCKHSLVAIFQDSYGRMGELSLGNLDFYGWNRIEVPIPPRFQKRDPKNKKLYGIYFKEFQIISSPKAEPGLCRLTLWGTMFLLDKTQMSYSGSEIPDNWH
ncbi:MAG: hypothetical protein D6767_10930 [Candidatus Hydrogenedentota bacterium]|nr:MAG: hypothetical protein D6767_10930 [Candidatus Hydrogenedentota bacterium]